MPFKSEKQRRYLWANEPEIARDWTDTYGSKIHKADGGRIGFYRGSDRHAGTGTSSSKSTGSHSRSRNQGGVKSHGSGGNRTSHHPGVDRSGYTPTHVRSGITPPKQPERDGILQSIKNFPDTMNRRGLKRNLDYYMGGKKLDFPLVAGIFKGAQEEDDYYTQFAGKSPLELKAQYGNVLDDEEIARVQQMSGVLGQDKITREDFVDAFYGPKGPPQPDTGGGGEGLPYIWPYEMASAPIEEEEIETVSTDPINRYAGSYRVRPEYLIAEGGRVPAAFGGIMDSYTGRRAYGLGSVFKKITSIPKKAAKAVKKLASSPIGKLALMYAAGTYLGGTQAMGGSGQLSFAQRLKDPKLLKNLINPEGWSWPGSTDTGKNLSKFAGWDAGGYDPALPIKTNKGNLLTKGLDWIKENPYPAILGGSLGAGLYTAKQPVEELDSVQTDYDNELAKWEEIFRPYKGKYRVKDEYLVAEGGRIGKQEGGLMDLGGMEKDYRNDGGFVPIGGQEKADDVPARLSRNEFVFTADAVRNAGGGDIDKGAQVMENVMKNLEAGGKVSEESQGQGAQEMFEVSERLSEVV